MNGDAVRQRRIWPMDSAWFSPCQKYRYVLSRDLGVSAACCFLMLNPSTADAFADDPTVNRCKSFARRWGHGWLWVVNLFPTRATDPVELWDQPEPADVVRTNLRFVRQFARRAAVVVAAFGTQPHEAFRERRDAVVAALANDGVVLQCLGVTQDGNPRHPLYVKASTELRPWEKP